MKHELHIKGFFFLKFVIHDFMTENNNIAVFLY